VGDYLIFFPFSFPRPSQSLGTTSGSPTLPSDCSACLVQCLAPAVGCLGHGSWRGALCALAGVRCGCMQPAPASCALCPSWGFLSQCPGGELLSAEERAENQTSGFCKMHCVLASLLSVTQRGISALFYHLLIFETRQTSFLICNCSCKTCITSSLKQVALKIINFYFFQLKEALLLLKRTRWLTVYTCTAEFAPRTLTIPKSAAKASLVSPSSFL